MNNRQALTLLFSANAVSGFAQGISMLAIPWYFARHNASGQFNLMYAGVTFISLFWGLYAGALVDRFDRKNTFLMTNVVEGFILLAIAAYGFATGFMPAVVVMLAFTTTVFGYNIHYPNLYAFIQEITEPKDYTRATSWIEIVGQATSIFSGAFAALLLEGVEAGQQTPLYGVVLDLPFSIPKWELWEIFLLDGITYFVSVMLIAFMRYKPYRHIDIETGHLLKRLRTGFHYLRDNRLILLFGLFSYSVFVALLVELFACMPMYVHNHLKAGASVFGAAEVAYAVGALGAGIFIGKLFEKVPTPKSIIILMLITVVVLLLAAFTRSVSLFMLISIIIGLTNAGTCILRVSYLFMHVPNEVVGRVNSIFSMANIVMRTAFILLFSLRFFSQGNNIVWAYAILGVFVLASALVLVYHYRSLVAKPEVV